MTSKTSSAGRKLPVINTLTAIPSKSLGLAWEPEEFIVELQARLIMPVFGTDGYCTACEAVMDSKGHHAKMCACWGDRVARHNAARNAVYRSAGPENLGKIQEHTSNIR